VEQRVEQVRGRETPKRHTFIMRKLGLTLGGDESEAFALGTKFKGTPSN
jgi:hypothetical protein